MNNLQVAKVVYAAQGALDETHGGAASPKWEELTEQQRAELAHDVGTHRSGVSKGVDPGSVAQNIGGKDKLKYLLNNAIVTAFSTYDDALKSQTQTSTAQPQTVQDAMAKAEQDIARGNASQENKPVTHGPFEDGSNIPGHELEPAKANSTQEPGAAQTAKSNT
jgi:hypothetical protein